MFGSLFIALYITIHRSICSVDCVFTYSILYYIKHACGEMLALDVYFLHIDLRRSVAIDRLDEKENVGQRTCVHRAVPRLLGENMVDDVTVTSSCADVNGENDVAVDVEHVMPVEFKLFSAECDRRCPT